MVTWPRRIKPQDLLQKQCNTSKVVGRDIWCYSAYYSPQSCSRGEYIAYVSEPAEKGLKVGCAVQHFNTIMGPVA